VAASEPKTGVRKKTTRCLIEFVAVDGSGDTAHAPHREPVLEDDVRLQKYAMHLAELRKEQEGELLAIDRANAGGSVPVHPTSAGGAA
jgi:acyl-CoA hydrolase